MPIQGMEVACELVHWVVLDILNMEEVQVRCKQDQLVHMGQVAMGLLGQP